eukprot:CAMPEP_0169370200 /NCGR_PEP_ID=MMETSP1017-20121227/35228_1 /TAXON_ID=342587 /ORGANISM="Karlodinium micrum, Strain CCMP2283" /LENGTH=114 /DNA_ID=CAMNT_0009468597 /DNA_START=83 /DNA_END=427 /DNA_ORIENTATION=+
MASRSKLLVVLAMIVVYSAWSDADVPDVVQVADAEEDGMEHADYGTQASTWMWSKWQMWKKWLMGADVADPELKGLPAGYKCGGSRRGRRGLQSQDQDMYLRLQHLPAVHVQGQ